MNDPRLPAVSDTQPIVLDPTVQATNMPSTKAPVSKPARPYISGRDPVFATIIVGPEETRFVVHESVLTHSSSFFRAALTGGFKEAQDKTVRLPEESPLIFESFVFWLYHGGLPTKAEGNGHELADAWVGDDTNTMTRNLMRLHIFSDKYGIADLALETLDTIFLRLEDSGIASPVKPDVYDVFEALYDTAPLCQFLVHLQCTTPAETWENSAMEDWHPLFLRGVLSRYAKMIKDAQKPPSTRIYFRKLDLCDYHAHVEKEDRTACKKQLVKKRRLVQKSV